MTPLEISLLAAAVPLVVALTAWLKAHTATKTANASNALSKKVASSVLSTPAPASNTVTEKAPDQAPSVQPPPL
jgi:hypothetical protein